MTSQPAGPVGEILRLHKGEIIDSFVAEMRRLGPPPGKNASLGLIAARFLDDLSGVLRREGRVEPSNNGRANAQIRWESGSDVRSVIEEYERVCSSMFAKLGQLSVSLQPEEAAAICRCMNAFIREAVVLYAQHRDDEHAGHARELELERTRLQSTLKILPVGVVLCDAEGTLVEANEAAMRIWASHLARPVPLGEYGMFRAWWPDSGRPVEAQEWALARAMEHGESVLNEEVDILAFDGVRRTILNSAAVIADATGTRLGGVAAFVDITDRKWQQNATRLLAEAGQVLSESLDYQATLERVTKLVVPTVADWCVVEVLEPDGLPRPQAAAVAHRDSVKQARIVQIRAEEIATQGGNPEVVAVIRSGTPRLVPRVPLDHELEADPELRERTRPWREIGIDSYMIVPLSAHGVVIGLITFVCGGSGRSYDAQSLWFAESLAQRAAHAIQNARLYAEAQAAVRTREDVVAIVSHDLRSPLSVLKLSAGALARMLDDSKTPAATLKQKTTVMLGAVARMEHLIGDLLDLSRMQAGRFLLETRPEDIPALVARAYDSASTLAEGKGVRASMDSQAEGRLACDGERLVQALANLLDNALRFTPKGGEIIVGTRAEGPVVRFFVRDTGPGIHEKQVPHLFERYWQAEAGTGRTGSGGGLGLAIARGIVEAHKGTIGVDTQIGHGSTFWFTVPRAAQA